MIPFPNIRPEIFTITIGDFDLSLRWYAVSYIAGFILAIFIMKSLIKNEKLWRFKTAPLDLDQAESLLTYLILGVIIGGRVGYVVFYNPTFYLSNPTEIIRVWDGGMAFHGGLIGVIFSIIVFCRVNGVQLLSCSDLVAIATPPGIMLGRIANFINAELWGRPTDMSWGVVFPGERAQACPEVSGLCARHPSQLYEAGLEGPLLFLLLIFFVYIGMLLRPGFITGVFIAGYGIARFFVELYRVPDPQFVSSQNINGYVLSMGDLGVTMGQMLSIPMIAIGVIFIFVSKITLKRS
jgi:phosphatidylglycerol:prolipoprotein diacylglycerol transferase